MSINKTFFMVLLTFCISILESKGQEVLNIKPDSICWNENYQLRWSDFQGNPDAKSEGIAACAASIYVSGFWDGKPNFIVTNCFKRKLAWTKDTTSRKVLEHESIHFDIAEVYARRIRKSIDSLRQLEIQEVSIYSEIIRSLLKSRNIADSLFDEQTKHGIYYLKQKEICEDINAQLSLLSKYAN